MKMDATEFKDVLKRMKSISKNKDDLIFAGNGHLVHINSSHVAMCICKCDSAIDKFCFFAQDVLNVLPKTEEISLDKEGDDLVLSADGMRCVLHTPHESAVGPKFKETQQTTHACITGCMNELKDAVLCAGRTSDFLSFSLNGQTLVMNTESYQHTFPVTEGFGAATSKYVCSQIKAILKNDWDTMEWATDMPIYFRHGPICVVLAPVIPEAD